MGNLYAAADIGSNTAHLLIAEVTPTGLNRILNESVWLSLGQVVTKHGTIPANEESMLFETLKRFKRAAEAHQVKDFYVFATEAMRVAENHLTIMQRVWDRLRIRIDLISAVREAELSYLGANLDTRAKRPSILIEVGGGSAQIALCTDRGITEEVSLRIGTGRLIHNHGLKTPCETGRVEILVKEIASHLDLLPRFGHQHPIISSGGVARGLVRALHPDGKREICDFELDYMRRVSAMLTPEQICSRFNVKLKRAESLLPGAAIFREVMRHFDVECMEVSEFGVREGAILEMDSRQ